MRTTRGFVYVLGNEATPHLYKIGSTSRHPSYRVEELSRATGVPQEFDLLLYADVENYKECEKELHERWSEFRINGAREFFKISNNELHNLFTDIEERALYIIDVQLFAYLYHPSNFHLFAKDGFEA